MNKKAEDYSIFIAKSKDSEEYIATSPEWPGLSGIGETRGRAILVLEDAIEGSLESHHEDGTEQDIPEPYALFDSDRLFFNKELESLIVSN